MNTHAPRRGGGFTLVETLVTVSILAVLLAVAIPSAIEWIVMERVRASAAEMASDIQFARAEAVRRNVEVAVTFRTNANETCYSIHTRNAFGPCNCLLGAGSACPALFGGNRFELKTTSVPQSSSVSMVANQNIIFDAVRGLPNGMALLQVDFDGGSTRQLRVVTNAAGRPQVCAPTGSKMHGYPTCV